MSSFHNAPRAPWLSVLLIGCSLLGATHAVHVQDDGEAKMTPVHPHAQKSSSHKDTTWLPSARVSSGIRKEDNQPVCVLDPAPAERIGYKNEPWQAVSFEIEMYPLKHVNDNQLKGNPGPKEALRKGMDLFEDKILKSVSREPGSCNDALFEVKAEDDENSWMFELEKHEQDRPYMFEASSPQEMGENETEIAVTMSVVLEKFFSKHPMPSLRNSNSWEEKGDKGVPDPPGLHVHVMGKCLLSDVRRLVAVLLIWERFDEAAYAITGMTLHKGAASNKAASIHDKSPQVLKHLMSYMTKDGWKEPDSDEPLADVFTEHGSRKEMKGDKENADGWRRLEVNICHLLHVKCAHNLPEKEAPAVPKFGALEFRGFDPNVGEPLRLIVMLVQRLVQFACSASLDGGGDLHKLAYWDGKKDEDSVEDLFNALEINSKHFTHEKFTQAKFALK